MYGMLLCMCYKLFWACHKYISLPHGSMEPSSPSTKELHALVKRSSMWDSFLTFIYLFFSHYSF